jgi:hypothetical protein
MTDGPIDLTHKVLPVSAETRDRHVWAAPPPGQGGSTQRICRACGQRVTVVGADSLCPGRHSEAVAETTLDYDPFGSM